MALPSMVTLGSAVLVLAAGVGLAAWSAADEEPSPDMTSTSTSRDTPARSASPSTDAAESPDPESAESPGSPDPESAESPGPQSAESPGPIADPPRGEPPQTNPDKPKDHQGSMPRKPEPDLAPEAPVEVYNNSGISGLAADKAALLQGTGWRVAATDNWYGAIPESTVYYPEELRADAEKLAEALGVDRVQPAVSPMSFDRLTVIFTSA